MPPIRKDPYCNSQYLVEIDGLPDTGFSRVILPECRIDPIEYREGIETRSRRKLLGIPAIGKLVLERGLTNSKALSDWYKAALEGNPLARRNIAITLLDEKNTNICRWKITGAIPMKYGISPLTAKGDEVLIETIELACESFQRDE